MRILSDRRDIGQPKAVTQTGEVQRERNFSPSVVGRTTMLREASRPLHLCSKTRDRTNQRSFSVSSQVIWWPIRYARLSLEEYRHQAKMGKAPLFLSDCRRRTFRSSQSQ